MEFKNKETITALIEKINIISLNRSKILLFNGQYSTHYSRVVQRKLVCGPQLVNLSKIWSFWAAIQQKKN
jgi:hypothetical protein